MEEGEKTYVEGFNAGYKLAKFQPDLVEKIQSSLSESIEYERGLIEGIQEWEREKEKIRAEELENLRSESQDQEQDISR
jgi:hypothetical protein